MHSTACWIQAWWACKLFTDTNSNSKPYKKGKLDSLELDYGSGSRSTHVIKDKGAGMTREQHLVTKMLGMGHNLRNCSVSHRRLDRLTCHTTCQTRQQSARRC